MPSGRSGPGSASFGGRQRSPPAVTNHRPTVSRAEVAAKAWIRPAPADPGEFSPGARSGGSGKVGCTRAGGRGPSPPASQDPSGVHPVAGPASALRGRRRSGAASTRAIFGAVALSTCLCGPAGTPGSAVDATVTRESRLDHRTAPCGGSDSAPVHRPQPGRPYIATTNPVGPLNRPVQRHRRSP